MAQALNDNFFLRRLHSLSGIVPVGSFLIFHLFANSVALSGAERYNWVIDFLRGLPFVEAIEWGFIFLPLIFHGAYGLLINSTSKPNTMSYPGLENWRYIIQRITGTILFVYIFYHVLQLKLVEDLDFNYVATNMASMQEIPFMAPMPFVNPFSIYWFSILGTLSATYHLANGIWGFCITWGITIGQRSQQILSIVALVVFIVLSYIGVHTTNHLADAGRVLLGN